MECGSLFETCLRSVLLRVALVVLATALWGTSQALAEGGPRKVDVELAIGVDVSWSMDNAEQMIQRDGYSRAFQSEEVIDAILTGGYRRIAVTYFEWAGYTSQVTIVPWTLIDSAAAARKFSDAIGSHQPFRLQRTSIAGAIDYARARFRSNGYSGVRRVVDISGDGPNNDGRPVLDARNEAIAAGITINGLPLMTNAPESYDAFKDLDKYYSNCVIGGNQAFMIPVTSWEEFPAALSRKLVLELAGLPAKAWHRQPLPVIRLQAKAKFNCRMGEDM